MVPGRLLLLVQLLRQGALLVLRRRLPVLRRCRLRLLMRMRVLLPDPRLRLWGRGGGRGGLVGLLEVRCRQRRLGGGGRDVSG